MEQNKHKTSQGEVWMDEDGILYQEYSPGAELKLEDSLGELEIYKTVYCKEGSRPIIVDITNVKTTSKESRDIYSSDETAEIIICSSTDSKPSGEPDHG